MLEPWLRFSSLKQRQQRSNPPGGVVWDVAGGTPNHPTTQQEGSELSIQAIETHYAGCRFRSRLEARWAVFFDYLGIRWEYEPEGFEVENGKRYLPDFYLPGLSHYVEVKGDDSMAPTEYREMLSSLIDYHGPLQDGLLLLGPISDVSKATTVLHSRLRWHEGVVVE